MSEPVPTLDVRDLTAGYGGPPIVEGVGCQARRGRITAVLGPNGAGKSTLLKAIAGVIPVTSGRVVIDGQDVTGLASEMLVRRGIAYVPQVANIFPSLTVRENLEIGAYTRRAGLSRRLADLCEMFPDLGAALRRQAQTLSGGQRNMLAMARGLMVDPAVLLLDEPTAGLAPVLVSAVWERIVRISESGVAVLVVEQNTRRTLQHASWAYVLTLGRNRLEGTGHELLNDEEVVGLYIGRGRRPPQSDCDKERK